jgi:hypothetical protein
MKTIIKVVIALAVLTAAAQWGLAAWANYQFQDAVHEALIFAPNSTDQEITKEVLELASNEGLPVGAGDVTVRQAGRDLFVDVSYEQDVAFLPGIYSRTMTFKANASTRLLPGVRRSPIR